MPTLHCRPSQAIPTAPCALLPCRSSSPKVLLPLLHHTHTRTHTHTHTPQQACFTGTSLLAALNLTKSLSFGDNLSSQFGQMAGFNVSKVRPHPAICL
jgi:hypothetical protein